MEQEADAPKPKRGRKPSVLGRLAGDFERAKQKYEAALERRANVATERLDKAVAEAKAKLDEATKAFQDALDKLTGDS